MKLNSQPKLFMLLLGCTPPGRHIEQHDILFAIGNSPNDLVSQVKTFWPEPERIHLDAWREVTNVNGHQITLVEKSAIVVNPQNKKLFFINLGGYIENQFAEQHYIQLSVEPDSASAIKNAKQTLFYKEADMEGEGRSHIDDKYGVDVDDLYDVEDILMPEQKAKYTIQITEAAGLPDDKIHLGYFKLKEL